MYTNFCCIFPLYLSFLRVTLSFNFLLSFFFSIQCTVTCGQGLRYRVVLCIDHRGLHTGGCSPKTKPHIKEECVVPTPCYKPKGNKAECFSNFSECFRVQPFCFTAGISVSSFPELRFCACLFLSAC